MFSLLLVHLDGTGSIYMPTEAKPTNITGFGFLRAAVGRLGKVITDFIVSITCLVPLYLHSIFKYPLCLKEKCFFFFAHPRPLTP